MTDRDDAVWNTLQGNWNQLKGKVREKWGLLTNDDMEHRRPQGPPRRQNPGEVRKGQVASGQHRGWLRSMNNEPRTTTTTKTTTTTTKF